MLTNNHDQGEINQANGQTSRNGHYEDDADNEDDDVHGCRKNEYIENTRKDEEGNGRATAMRRGTIESREVMSWQNILWRIAWCDIITL